MPSRRLAINIVNSTTNIWIPNVNRLIQSIIRKCPQCARFNSRQRQPQLGDLPQERISLSTPFSHTGLDYCRPITAKTVKIYVSIFICFSTNAVHLEPVNSLTKEASISTLQHFFCSPRTTNCHLQ